MTDKEEADHEADDLVEDIYDETAPEHAVVSRKDFKPWHHPRKHWVRINQLCRLSRELIAESHFPDDVLRYLTLPGEELIDVQAMEIIAKEGSEEFLDIQALEGAVNYRKGADLKLKYIGFNNVGRNKEKRAALELAESTIQDSDIIHRSSRVINDQVQNIAASDSASFNIVKGNGPYNIINLDLCSSVANTSPDAEKNTYFEAIGQILVLQRSHMPEPFIMFITTKTTPSEIHPKSLESITAVYGENFRRSAEFKGKFEEMVEEEAEQLLAKIAAGENVEQASLNRVFGVGLGKWLLHIMKPNAPHWDVSLEDICCYSIGEYEENMLSLAFKFKKVQQNISDSFGLLKKLLPGNPGNEIKSESDLALEMLNQSETITNVDTLLQDDKEERDQIIGQAGRLLEKSGYSQEEYLTWANSFFNDPAQATSA